MFRRKLLRRGGSALGATAALGLAGCSGDDGSAEDEGDDAETEEPTDGDSGDTTEASPSTETDAMQTTASATTTEDGGERGYVQEDRGSIAENAVEELEIVGWESRVGTSASGDEVFVVTLSIRNTGDVETELINYWIELTLYDENGSELSVGGSGASRTDETSPPPGEVGVVEIEATMPDDSPDAVASYEITWNCTLSEDAAYCDG